MYRLHSNQGVEITVDDGQMIFIGSQSPEELKTALKETIAVLNRHSRPCLDADEWFLSLITLGIIRSVGTST